jgi:hypothetical protein
MTGTKQQAVSSKMCGEELAIPHTPEPLGRVIGLGIGVIEFEMLVEMAGWHDSASWSVVVRVVVRVRVRVRVLSGANCKSQIVDDLVQCNACRRSSPPSEQSSGISQGLTTENSIVFFFFVLFCSCRSILVPTRANERSREPKRPWRCMPWCCMAVSSRGLVSSGIPCCPFALFALMGRVRPPAAAGSQLQASRPSFPRHLSRLPRHQTPVYSSSCPCAGRLAFDLCEICSLQQQGVFSDAPLEGRERGGQGGGQGGGRGARRGSQRLSLCVTLGQQQQQQQQQRDWSRCSCCNWYSARMSKRRYSSSSYFSNQPNLFCSFILFSLS